MKLAEERVKVNGDKGLRPSVLALAGRNKLLHQSFNSVSCRSVMVKRHDSFNEGRIHVEYPHLALKKERRCCILTGLILKIRQCIKFVIGLL